MIDQKLSQVRGLSVFLFFASSAVDFSDCEKSDRRQLDCLIGNSLEKSNV